MKGPLPKIFLRAPTTSVTRLTTGRQNTKILGQLEVVKQRPGDPKYSERLGNSIDGNPTTEKDTSGCQNEQPRGDGNGQGDRKHAVQRGYKGGHPKGGSIPKQCIRNPKRGGSVSPHYQPQETERVCSLPSFQDGGAEGCEAYPKRGRLDVQNRLERCILLSPSGNSIPKISPFQVERETVRVSLPSFWPGSSTQDIHKTDESPCSHPKETGNFD